MFFLFSNYFAVDTASAIAIALMTFGTMYPMSVYSGKVLLQVMVIFQYACLKLAMFFYQVIKINVFFCQIMKFLATGGSYWKWSQAITSEICIVRTRWNYVGVQNRHKWVFIYLHIRQKHKWETLPLIIFQVKNWNISGGFDKHTNWWGIYCSTQHSTIVRAFPSLLFTNSPY